MKSDWVVTKSTKEFDQIVADFSAVVIPKTVIILNGDLGVGKTYFVQQLAKNLGIEEIVTSPTYSIMKCYGQKLCHVDAYRINEEDLGLSEYLEQGFVVCIEWSENISNYIPYINYNINIDYTSNFNERKITIEEVKC